MRKSYRDQVITAIGDWLKTNDIRLMSHEEAAENLNDVRPSSLPVQFSSIWNDEVLAAIRLFPGGDYRLWRNKETVTGLRTQLNLKQR